MKLIEIKCPFCGGKINQNKIKDKMITCEYCGNTFYLDDEKEQYITNYNIYQNTPKENHGSAALLFGIGGFLLVVFLFVVLAQSNGTSDKDRYQSLSSSQADAKQESETAEGLYRSIVEGICGKPFEKVSEEEIADIRYLSVENGRGGAQVEYSLDDSYGENPQIHTLTLPYAEWGMEDLNHFPGLVRVNVNGALSEYTDLSGLKELKGLICTDCNLEKIAGKLADPAGLLELVVGDVPSLEGIEQFGDLEILHLENVQDGSLKPLIALKKLRELQIKDDYSDYGAEPGQKAIEDYGVISKMTQLERLALESEVIRDFSFLQGLDNLQALSISETQAISLAPLTELSALTELEIRENDELKDYAPISGLTGLKILKIDKSTGQPDPDLSALTALESLEIAGFMEISSLNDLTNLKELAVYSSNMQGVEALSSLRGLERLTLNKVWIGGGKLSNLDFVSEMQELRYVDLGGHGGGYHDFMPPMEVYGDISAVFCLPKLEELYLDRGSFEIVFSNISSNPSLRVLGLESMDLNENYYVESDGFMSSIWYDDVVLDEHTDFLRNFPNLEELYLASNELTGLDFAAALTKLKRLDIRDNYITDLSPLQNAENLEYLNVEDNPVQNLPDTIRDIEIVQ